VGVKIDEFYIEILIGSRSMPNEKQKIMVQRTMNMCVLAFLRFLIEYRMSQCRGGGCLGV
jgi:hypothetical protein